MSDHSPEKSSRGGLFERVYEADDLALIEKEESLRKGIAQAYEQLRAAKTKIEVETISFTIKQLKEREKFVQDQKEYKKEQHAKIFKEHLKFKEGMHKYEWAFKVVGEGFGVSLADLKNNIFYFLAVKKQNHLLQEAIHLWKKKKKAEKKRRAKETKKPSEESSKSDQDFIDLTQQYETLKRQYEEIIRENQRLRREKETNEQTIEELRQRESRIEHKVDQALKIWHDQQKKIRRGEKPLANENYGILLAEALLEMHTLFDKQVIKNRDEPALRDILLKKLKNAERDYFSDMCRDAVQQCNHYIRKQHPQQSLIASVLPEEVSLEVTVLAFDHESPLWWWLSYVHRPFTTDSVENEMEKEFREFLIKNKGLKYNTSFQEFLAAYESDPEIQQMVDALFFQSFDKSERKASNTH